MNETGNVRAFERVTEVQFKSLRNDMGELKDRVVRLEEKLTRGVMLLVANLAGVVVILARAVMGL